LRLERAELVSVDDADAIETGRELIFRVTINTRKVIEGAYVSLNIFDTYGNCIYWSADIGSERFRHPTPGISTVVCTCPPYLLTPGRYSILFSIYCIGRGVIHHEENRFLTLIIHDTESWLARHGIAQPGVTAVRSVWKSEGVGRGLWAEIGELDPLEDDWSVPFPDAR
jgi:hypothetical protein